MSDFLDRPLGWNDWRRRLRSDVRGDAAGCGVRNGKPALASMDTMETPRRARLSGSFEGRDVGSTRGGSPGRLAGVADRSLAVFADRPEGIVWVPQGRAIVVTRS